ncbi:MAG: GGDEF domain-containing protein [Solirubrobacterales bacterium]
MQNQALHYFPLAAIAIAAFIGLAQARKMNRGVRPKSHSALTRAAVWITVAFAGGLLFSDDKLVLIVQAFAFLSVIHALVEMGKESQTYARIAAQQRVDFVTGLYNRRTFDERLFAEHSRTKRTGTKYAVAVFQVDDYDKLSKRDRLNGMKLLAKSLDESVRHTDTLARITDEHIAVMMVDTEAEGGIIGVERARERFFFQSCGHDETAHVTRPLTTSVGIAAFDDDTVDAQDVIANAEQALRLLNADGEPGIRISQRADDRATETFATAA